jgi:hypothetical protein
VSLEIDNKKIKIRINNFNERHSISLGYVFKKNDYIEISIKELPIGSGLKIDVKCNYCDKVFKKAYRRYIETKDDICCNECRSLKMMKTSLKKYGNICSLRNKDILQKSKNTNLKKIGVEYPFQDKGILKKCVESFKINGCTHGVFVSKPQIYLNNLFGGEIDCIEFPYRLDSFFKNKNLYFEYDGSGHEMLIKMGKVTKEEFEEKEMKRSIFFKEKGYKEFRIVSFNDIFPSDEKLLEIKNRAFDLLLNKNYQKYVYNLNTKTESFEE